MSAPRGPRPRRGVGGMRPPPVTTGAFPDVSRIESDLKRGVSTKIDVQRLLGAPNGLGNSLLPPDSGPREVWFYEDVASTGMRSGEDVTWVDLRQQILLVFFEQEKFDGFMWFTGVTSSEVR